MYVSIDCDFTKSITAESVERILKAVFELMISEDVLNKAFDDRSFILLSFDN